MIAPRALPPTAPAMRYARALRALGAAMDHTLLDALASAGYRVDDDASELASARVALDRLVRSGRVLAVVRAAWDATDKRAREQFLRQIRSSFGINVLSQPHLAALYERFVRQNVQLIKSLADDKLERVRQVIDPSVRHEDLAKTLRAELRITQRRATLIAVDQVFKTNAAVTQARHQAAGVTEFVWSTSRDERVRPEHKRLEGKQFAYSDPPVIDGKPTLPGHAVRCRCLALPVLPA